MNDRELLIQVLDGGESAWKEFLRRYTNLFLKIIWQFERDRDRVMEMYLQVCSRVTANNFTVLRRYIAVTNNPPKLGTWLAAVVRNMCIDTYRAGHGRHRFPKALQRMSELERKVFALFYWRGYSVGEIEHHVGNPDEDIVAVLERIDRSLYRRIRVHGNDEMAFVSYDDTVSSHAATPDPGNDLASGVEDLLHVLSREEKLVIMLRFWEDMPAPEIAELLQIPSSERVCAILQKGLRKMKDSIIAERRLHGSQSRVR